MRKAQVCIITILIFLLCLSGFLYANNQNADFTMTESTLNIKASDIISIEGSFTSDEAQYQRNTDIVIDYNKSDKEDVNGQIFLHCGKGDTFTFKVDFNDKQVYKFVYAGYGLSVETKLNVYADDALLGTAVIKGGNGWLDGDKANWQWGFFEFQDITGVKEIKVVVTEGATAWPGNAFGNFIFVSRDEAEKPDFIADKDGFNIKGSDLLSIPGAFSDDETTFDRQGHGIVATGSNEEIPEEVRGQMLLNCGKGDKFTFTVDFGSNEFTTLGYYSYGASDISVIEIFVDGESLCQGDVTGGNGWADTEFDLWNYNEIYFSKPLTGLCTITIKIIESPEIWPANVFGNFLFFMEQNSSNTPVPEETPVPSEPAATPTPGKTNKSNTDDKSELNNLLIPAVIAFIIVIAIVIVILVVRRRRKMHKVLCVLMILISLFSFVSCDNKNIINQEEISYMRYSEKEKAQMDAYQQKQAGVKLSIYKYRDYNSVMLTGTVSDIGDGLPITEKGRYSARYEGFICFKEDGEHKLSIEGKNADITIVYGELYSEKYDGNTKFLADTYYGIKVDVDFDSDEDMNFISSSEYKLSLTQPVFGGECPPTEPIADIHIRDPFILKGHDGYYYMTGTNNPVDWANTEEIHVYKSEDLKSWADLGAVWSFERDATWQKALTNGTSPVWAPEIHYINNNYWIIYSIGWGSMTSSILKSTTGLPEGPYEDVSDKPMFDYIDGTLFQDDDGAVYTVYSDGRIARMSDDLTSSAEEPRRLLSASGCTVGFEGCAMFKYEGKYYLISSTYNTHIKEDGTTYVTYDSMYAFSDNIYGPYSERRLLLKYGGHGNIFETKDEKIYTTLFFGESFSERPAVVELSIQKDGFITTALKKTETIKIDSSSKTFTLGEQVNENSLYVIKLKSRGSVDVYVNDKFAFKSQESGATYISYIIDVSLLSDVTGVYTLSYSKERNMNLDAYFEIWENKS